MRIMAHGHSQVRGLWPMKLAATEEVAHVDA